MKRLDYAAQQCLVFLATCCMINQPQSVLNAAAHLVCHTRKYTTTSLICSVTCTGCGFPREYTTDWPWSSSAVVTTWRLRTSPVTCAGPTRQKRYNVYRPIMPRTRLGTIGDPSLRVTVTRTWNLYFYLIIPFASMFTFMLGYHRYL